jgi:hypothetical protein
MVAINAPPEQQRGGIALMPSGPVRWASHHPVAVFAAELQFVAGSAQHQPALIRA